MLINGRSSTEILVPLEDQHFVTGPRVKRPCCEPAKPGPNDNSVELFRQNQVVNRKMAIGPLISVTYDLRAYEICAVP